ncbi:MAG: alkaline phosphatase family protein [Thermoplasmata archaeon]|nr:alkaline phosphatase family protein [Thermoplasmata archaeon]
MTRPAFAPPEDPAARRVWSVDASTGLPKPRYDGRSIVNLAVSVQQSIGRASKGSDSPLALPLTEDLDPFHGRRARGTVVVVLVDALGWTGFRHWCEGAGEAGRVWGQNASPITTVFPSTTTAALVSLSTGVPPGRHGVVGYRQYLPRYGVVGDMLNMTPVGVGSRDSLIGPGWRPSDITGAPTLFRRGLNATVLSRDIFEGTGFTRLLYDGAEFVGYATAVHLVQQLVAILKRPRPPPAVFVYWPDLDTIQHLAGTDPRWFDMELDRLVHLIERTAAELPRNLVERITVAVTGDHGQVLADPALTVAVDEEPSLVQKMVRPLAGDRRAGFFAARPGRQAALRKALVRRLLPKTPVLDRQATLDAGLFGPPPFHPEIDERIGDVIALPRSPQCLTYRVPGAALPKRFLIGAHGGLEADELIVPLIQGSLAELGSVRSRLTPSKA